METRKLKILIVEDKPEHRKSIEELVQEGHIVDVAKDLSEAIGFLGGFPSHVVKQGKTSEVPYDVVLTDMMFPVGGSESGVYFTHGFDRSEVAPLGYSLALYASQRGVPYIAIYTDATHHGGPVPATMDLFDAPCSKSGDQKKKMRLTVGGSVLVMYDIRDSPRKLTLSETGAVVEKYSFDKRVKDWAGILDLLVYDGAGKYKYREYVRE